MENAISQGYPMFAAVSEQITPEGGEPFERSYVGLVIGWDRTGGGDLLAPIVMEIGSEGSFAAVIEEGAAVQVATKRSLLYVGNDIKAAREAAGPDAPTTSSAAFQGVGAPAEGTRYARGATALCAGWIAHDAHLWMPDGHDYLIACPGQPAG